MFARNCESIDIITYLIRFYMEFAKKNPRENLFIFSLHSIRIIVWPNEILLYIIALKLAYSILLEIDLNWTSKFTVQSTIIWFDWLQMLLWCLVEAISMCFIWIAIHFTFARHSVCLAIRPFPPSHSLPPTTPASPSLALLLSPSLSPSRPLELFWAFFLSLPLTTPCLSFVLLLVISAFQTLPLAFVFRMVNPFNERSN